MILFYAYSRRGDLFIHGVCTHCARCMFARIKQPSAHPSVLKYYHTRLSNRVTCGIMHYSYMCAIMLHYIGFYARSNTGHPPGLRPHVVQAQSGHRRMESRREWLLSSKPPYKHLIFYLTYKWIICASLGGICMHVYQSWSVVRAHRL